jgi:valyl-tRNA synthetase
MPLDARYHPADAEPRLYARWAEAGMYEFDRTSTAPVFSIDTPPPTVSGHLHLGHVYSYSHTDFIARYQRMRGRNVYYPMGFDDNGLPTERLVEKTRGVTAPQIGRQAFIELCLAASEEAEKEYRALWQRLGLSVAWRYTYRSIGELARRTSQRSFLDLYRAGLVYRQEAPAIWCPECRTAIAQAELEDLERETEFVTLAFTRPDGTTLPIATTRPELLPACVAVFVPPNLYTPSLVEGRGSGTPDGEFEGDGGVVRVPLYDFEVPVLADASADPNKGTGVVMCCTFGDSTDVDWWRAHHLPLRAVLGRDGRMTEAAGPDLAGLTAGEARARILDRLETAGLILDRRRVTQSVRIHERCDTPVEYVVANQWFVRVLDYKRELLEAGARIAWRPETMAARYREWVEGLRWDWCISRQRYFGVPFPVWYCADCGEIALADESQLPVDPAESRPARPCACGSDRFLPDEDVMDTWATSSLSPQIAGRWLSDPDLYARVFPFSLRPQAHEIIRTWAFYTLVKSLREFDALPWSDVAISGWGIAAPSTNGERTQKISKSKGGGPIAPMAIIERYSADATRYWAASTGPGKDAVISEEKVQMGAKLITKLWNVARFAERFIGEERRVTPSTRRVPRRKTMKTPRNAADPLRNSALHSGLLPADRWLLSRLQGLIARVTSLLDGYEYAAAKSEIEVFFWTHLTDNYLELAKERLYGDDGLARDAAYATLATALLTVLKLFAPFLPYVAEEIYQALFAGSDQGALDSIHRSAWPDYDETLVDAEAERAGDALVALATAVRRYKSEAGLSLGAPLARLEITASDPAIAHALSNARADLRSVTRAREIAIVTDHSPEVSAMPAADGLSVGMLREEMTHREGAEDTKADLDDAAK